MRTLVLASQSPYRQLQLAKLRLPFVSFAPNIDESSKAQETAEDLVLRLSITKAQKAALDYPNALIIGSDQVAIFEGRILGKPGNHEKATQQLLAFSGKKVLFLTGLCLFDSASQQCQSAAIPFEVTFRTLSEQQIDRYLLQEQPYDCAGSFKSEGLGIALFEKMSGDDPNSLIGLPLIQLTSMLYKAGVDVL